MDELLGARLDRRAFLRIAALAGTAASGLAGCVERAEKSLIHVPAGQTVARFPEKAQLIMLTDRPPQLETPLYYFKEMLTPNDAFFVRWHYAGIQTSIDPKSFTLSVNGLVGNPISLGMEELRKQFDPTTITAVCQCSGNSRSRMLPPVPGGQWGEGAMGNARWTGVRLKDLLKKAGIKSGAVEVAFAGTDEAPLSNMPKFCKSLKVDHALSGEVLVAYEMNGAPLPVLNGFPLRLVVPGWYATYWVKALTEITVLPETLDSFWMKTAYRIPNNATANELPKTLATDTVPINKLNLRSIFVVPEMNATVSSGEQIQCQGIAFDAGSGIKQVDVSTDGGNTFMPATLVGPDLGNYSWRQWRFDWRPDRVGKHTLAVRATSNSGAVQTNIPHWNRSGYMRNVIEKVEVKVV
ncbi:MAG: molybdopterin-dependent oxidoreductase [Candidatus Obscuribacterales bacterium]